MKNLNWTVASVCAVPMYTYIYFNLQTITRDRSISSRMRLYKCVRIEVCIRFTTFLSWPVEGHVGISHSTDII